MRTTLPLALAIALAVPALAQPLTTAFTYQGELSQSGTPANGTFDLRFALYEGLTGGVQVGSTLCVDDIVVTNGRFAVQLDFGAQFTGQQRYLEVLVRPDAGAGCGDASNYTTLLPRTELSAAPHAAFALSAASALSADTANSATSAQSAQTAAQATNAAQLNGQPPSFYTNAGNLTGTLPSTLLSGLYSNPLTLSSATNQFTGTFTGSGAAITALNASNITTGTLANARTTGTPSPVAHTLVLRDGSNGFSAGAINATSFTGNGSTLIALNASNISTGTIANARTTGTPLNTASTLVLRDASGNFTAGAITATTLSAGTVSASTLSGGHIGDGSALTNLSAASLTGTVSDARLSTNVATLSAPQTFTGLKTFSAAPSFSAASGAPFTVASTAPVTNLNADLLDGLSSAAFARLTGSQTFTGDITIEGAITIAGATANLFSAFGTVTPGTNYGFGNLAAGGRTYALVATANSHTEGAGKLLLRDGVTSRLSIDSTGNVGINTPAPAARLDVNGAIRAQGGVTFPDGSTQHRAAPGSTTPFVTSGLPANATFTVTLGGTSATLSGTYTVNRTMQVGGGGVQTPTGGYSIPQGAFTVRRARTADQTWANWITGNTSPALTMVLTVGGSTVTWSGTMTVRQLRLVTIGGTLYEEAELYPQGNVNLTRTVSGAPAVSAPSTDSPGMTFNVNNNPVPNTVAFAPSAGLSVPIDPTTGMAAGNRSVATCTVRANPFSSGIFRTNFISNVANQAGAIVTSGTNWRTTSSCYPTSYTLRLADDGLPIEEYTMLMNN
ncbi:MAG TPA: hypothetical protein VD997_06980 [Phycisphaerales bacterium]|nr:hypothetical protein [Phycisphaerales bacterium]